MYRNILKILIWVLIMSVFTIIYGDEKEINNLLKDKDLRVVSMQVLQQRFENYQNNEINSKLSLQLGGITNILGFILDKSNEDILLFGSSEQNLPPIYTEDFVVALRNAWMKYADLRGNTYYYSDPGCSIDPDPAVMKKLNTIGEELMVNTSREQTKNILNNWIHICSSPQKVRVMGIPFDSHFAEVMVTADYNMKNIVNGVDSLNISGLHSLTKMNEMQILQDIQNKKSTTLSISMNRFWFYPGKIIYNNINDMFVIQKCPVILLTENEYNNSGSQDDPLADQFAHDLTLHYEELAEERLMYQELKNLFCMVSISKILKDIKDEFIDVNFSYLLNEYIVPQTPVQRTLPGRSNIREFTHRVEISNGYRVYNMWLPSCGGVDIDINADNIIFKTPEDSLWYDRLRKKILQKNSNGNFYWDIDQIK